MMCFHNRVNICNPLCYPNPHHHHHLELSRTMLEDSTLVVQISELLLKIPEVLLALLGRCWKEKPPLLAVVESWK